jgi:hypothetical protein
MGMNYRIIISITLTLLLTHCGIYSAKGSLPGHIHSISVSPVINTSAEFGVDEEVENSISDKLITENVLNVTSESISDSRLNITITSVIDRPYTYSVKPTLDYEQVDEWRITIKSSVIWYDMTRDEALFERTFSSWGAYGVGVDINSDKIDNDGDGLIDSDDDDEYGSPRESALKVAIRKLSEDIIIELTSTW